MDNSTSCCTVFYIFFRALILLVDNQGKTFITRSGLVYHWRKTQDLTIADLLHIPYSSFDSSRTLFQLQIKLFSFSFRAGGQRWIPCENSIKITQTELNWILLSICYFHSTTIRWGDDQKAFRIQSSKSSNAMGNWHYNPSSTFFDRWLS